MATTQPSVAIPGAGQSNNDHGIHSASEDDSEWRAKMGRSQVDASVLYSNPRKLKTRTYSESRGDETTIRQRLNYPVETDKPSLRQRRLSHGALRPCLLVFLLALC